MKVYEMIGKLKYNKKLLFYNEDSRFPILKTEWGKLCLNAKIG